MSPKVPFHVKAANGDAELFLIDCDFSLKDDRGIGEKVWTVEPGPYKVKARRGTAIFEKVILVRGGAPKFEVPHLAFASPSPIPGTAWTHAHHIAADRAAATRMPDVERGDGSAIVIMAREWTGLEKSIGVRPELNPARGLSLLTLDGKTIVDLDEPPHYDFGWEPWATCHIAVAPGAYRLRRDPKDRPTVEMMLIASPGWQTHVYLLTETPRPPEERYADLVNGTISLRRREDWNEPEKHEQIWQLEEIVRQTLIDDRTKLCSFLESQIDREETTPMLLLYTAHVLINDARKNKVKDKPGGDRRTDVARIVQRLRPLLGNDHPDVEALAYGAEVASPDFRFNVPPMLRGGWLRLLSESTRREDLFGADSFTDRIEGRLWGDGPWLFWTSPDVEEDFDRDAVWMARAEEVLADLIEQSRTKETPAAATPATLSQRLMSVVADARSLILKDQLPAFPETLTAAARPERKAAIDEARLILNNPAQVKELVKALGLPADTIREWLRKRG